MDFASFASALGELCVKNAIDEAKTADEAREVHVVSIAPL